ncbi:MAG: hypothetical protein AAGC97_15325 [Planctomycetota bacterium]
MSNLTGPLASIVCPWCPLHCDDLVVDSDGSIRAGHCKRGTDALSKHPISRLDAEHLERLRRIDSIGVETAGVDLVTARQLVHLDSAGRIRLSVRCDDSIAAWIETTRRDGTSAGTLSEIAARADFVWTIGETESAWPRFAEKAGRLRVLDRGGRWMDDPLLDLDSMPARLATIDAMEPAPEYLAVVIGPGAMRPNESAITAGLLGRWIRRRNETQRTIGVTLDAAVTIQSVSLWQRNRTIDRLVDAGAADPMEPVIRIGDAGPGDESKVDLQIGGSDPGPSRATMFQPAAQMGIHQRSMVVRGDGSVTLPLAEIRGGVASLPALPSIVERLRTVLND